MNTPIVNERSISLHRVSNIAGAALLGGPFAPMYMIYQNFKFLQKDHQAKLFLLYSLFGTLAMFLVIIMLGESSVRFGFYIFIISWILAEALQGKDLKQHKITGGEFVSIWKTILICLLSLVVTFLVFYVVGMIV